MRYLEVLGQPFLKNGVFGLLKSKLTFDIFSYKFSKKLSNRIKQAKNSALLKNTVLFVFLFAVPSAAVMMKDYMNDQIERREAEGTAEKALLSYSAEYVKLLEGIKDKILSEKLYSSQEGMQQLLGNVNVLKTHATSAVRKVEGLRWVSSDLKAIGLYGVVHNFDQKPFLNFLRSLDQAPNTVQMITVSKVLYFGMAIAEGSNTIGYLLLPTPLEIALDSKNVRKVRTFQLVPELSIPALGIPLDALTKKPSSYFRVNKIMTWSTYGLENVFAFGVFLLFACIFLFFKRKNDRKKEVTLLQLKQKGEFLINTVLAQQKMANIVIHRLHEINRSIGEISNVLLETHSSGSVFTAQEQMNFIHKVCDFSAAIDNKVMKTESTEAVDLKEVISNCINFYGYKLSEANIKVQQEYHLTQLNFFSAKDAFNQLVINLFHMALERTPEKGNILMTVKESETEKNESFRLTIQDNGYSFSSTELQNYKKPSQPIFEDYFDLGWEGILELARHINCRVSDEKISPVGNRITLTVQEHKALKDESKYEEYAAKNNIIKLFPTS